MECMMRDEIVHWGQPGAGKDFEVLIPLTKEIATSAVDTVIEAIEREPKLVSSSRVRAHRSQIVVTFPATHSNEQMRRALMTLSERLVEIGYMASVPSRISNPGRRL